MTTGQKVAAQLDELDTVREDFIDNLETKGITGLIGDEKYEELVEKILEIPSGSSDIYKVATIAERDSLSASEGDICLVYNELTENIKKNINFINIKLSDVITLEEPLFEDLNTRMLEFMNENEDWSKSLSIEYTSGGLSGPREVNIRFEDYDTGIFYNNKYISDNDELKVWRLQSGGNNFPEGIIDLEINFYIASEMGANAINLCSFMDYVEITFSGIFIYSNNSWNYLNIGLDTLSGNIALDKKAYTNSGVLTGTFGNTPTTKEEVLLCNKAASSCGSYILPTDCSDYFSNMTDDVFVIGSVLNTTNVTSMTNLFSKSSFIHINLSNMNANNVTSMYGMFNGCSNLTEIDLSNINTNSTKLFNLRNMFFNCSSLTYLDASGLNVNKTNTLAGSMFFKCINLMHLDIRNMELNKFQETNSMFGNNITTNRIPANCLIIVKDNTQKQWINSNFNWLTNVKTATEYEAEQGGAS